MDISHPYSALNGVELQPLEADDDLLHDPPLNGVELQPLEADDMLLGFLSEAETIGRPSHCDVDDESPPGEDEERGQLLVTKSNREVSFQLAGAFDRIPLRVYMPMLLQALLPTVYNIVRLSFLGDLPADEGIQIAAQIVWVQVVLEIVDDVLMRPLYNVVGERVDDREFTKNMIITGACASLALHLAIAIPIAASVPGLCPLIGIPMTSETLDSSSRYIRLEMIGVILNSGARFLLVAFTHLSWTRTVLDSLILKTIACIVGDIFLLSHWSCSFKIGVNGIAFSNIIACFLALCYGAITVRREYKDVPWERDWDWLRLWPSSIGCCAGVESCFRNLAYVFVVLRMLNFIKEQSTYTYGADFTPGWLLLLYLPLAELLKQDVVSPSSVRGPSLHLLPSVLHPLGKTGFYLFLALALFALWLVSQPLWHGFLKQVMHVEGPIPIIETIRRLMPFVLFYMIDTLMESVFYGRPTKKTLRITSVINNTLLLIPFGLFEIGWLRPTLQTIIYIFGANLIFNFIVHVRSHC